MNFLTKHEIIQYPPKYNPRPKHYIFREKVNKKKAIRLLNLTTDSFSRVIKRNYINNLSELTIKDDKGKISKSLEKALINDIRKYLYYVIENDDIQVKYKHGKNDRFGRQYAETLQGFSIQPSSRLLRNYLLEGVYADYDMKCCHFQLLLMLVKGYNLGNYSLLEKYTTDTKKFLNEYHLTKMDVIINGLYSDTIPDGLTDKVKLFYEELHLLRNQILGIEEVKSIFKQNEKHKNKEGSTLSSLLCYLESQVMDLVLDTMKKENKKSYNYTIPVYDGLMVLKDMGKDDGIDVRYFNTITEPLNIKWAEKDVKNDNYNGIDFVLSTIHLTYSQKKVEWEKKYCLIRNPCCLAEIVIHNDNEYIVELNISKNRDMFKEYQCIYHNTNCGKGEDLISTEQFLEIWLKDKNRKVYERCQFLPYSPLSEDPLKDSKTILNSFRGFRSKIVEVDENDVDIKRFIKHIKLYICNNNEEYFNYVIKWLAFTLQSPEKRQQTACVFIGEQGSGKSSIYNFVSSMIDGVGVPLSKDYLYCCNVEEISKISKFNNIIANKLLLNLEEIDVIKHSKIISTMKTMITDPTILIEKKGFDTETAINHLSIMGTSNEPVNVVKIDNDDRRYNLFETTSLLLKDKEHQNWIGDSLGNQDVINKLYSYMLKHDLSDFRPKEIIETEIRSQILVNSLHPMINFLKEQVDKYNSNVDTDKSKNYQFETVAFQKDFQVFLRANSEEKLYNLSSRTFNNHLTKHLRNILICKGAVPFKQLRINNIRRNYYIFGRESTYDFITSRMKVKNFIEMGDVVDIDIVDDEDNGGSSSESSKCLIEDEDSDDE